MQSIQRYFLWIVVLLALCACRPSVPPVVPAQSPTTAQPSAAQTTTPTPEIVSVRLALGIDAKTRKLRGTGNIFKLGHLQQNRRLHVAILLKALQGAETLTLTLIGPDGKESEPIVKQYAAADHGDYFETAYFDATHWRSGTHHIKVNLNDVGFAVSEFAVIP